VVANGLPIHADAKGPFMLAGVAQGYFRIAQGVD